MPAKQGFEKERPQGFASAQLGSGLFFWRQRAAGEGKQVEVYKQFVAEGYSIKPPTFVFPSKVSISLNRTLFSLS